MDKIRVLLVEDHTIVRKGLCSLLDGEVGIKVVGEAEDGREAIQKAEALQPHVVVMDIAMPGLNGLEATRQLKKRAPEIKIIILTMHANEEYVLQTLRAGASGYLVKKAAPTELISAIRAVYEGESFLSPAISRTVINDYIRRAEKTSESDEIHDKLTNREREVFQLIVEGHKNREISRILHVSVKTVETHKARIMDKLNVSTTAKLIRYAYEKNLMIE